MQIHFTKHVVAENNKLNKIFTFEKYKSSVIVDGAAGEIHLLTNKLIAPSYFPKAIRPTFQKLHYQSGKPIVGMIKVSLLNV